MQILKKAQAQQLRLERNFIAKSKAEVMNKEQQSDVSTFLRNLRSGIWFVGISSWIFGITDRAIAALADGYLSAWDIILLSTASFFFVSWQFLKPNWR